MELCMLCQPLDQKNLERNFKLAPTLLVQPKLDGMRCLVKWEGDEPILFSRQGHIITGVPHIQILLKEWAEVNLGHPELDGELYIHNHLFEDIVGACKRSLSNLHPDFAAIEYHVFDMAGTSLTDSARQKHLDRLFETMPNSVAQHGIFKRVDTGMVKSFQDVDLCLRTYHADGYEGIIVRNPLATYQQKRPFTILKWKPGKSDVYTIDTVLQAYSEEGIPLSRAGSLVCVDENGYKFKCGPGVGCDHSHLMKVWDLRNMLEGQRVVVKYQNLTKYGVPRFGKFDPLTLDVYDEI